MQNDVQKKEEKLWDFYLYLFYLNVHIDISSSLGQSDGLEKSCR